MQTDFSSKFKDLARRADVLIAQFIDKELVGNDLAQGCAYVMKTPGKRVRPALTFAVAELIQLDLSQVQPLALALECLHTASLVHDDLPLMDNQAIRRGNPTCHVKFGDAIALLVGDALIAKALGLVASNDIPVVTAQRLSQLLANATYQLCEGQVMDLNTRLDENLPAAEVRSLLLERHMKKTGALILAAVLGPTHFVEDFDSRQYQALKTYAENLGLLFQITDDVLDVTEKCETLGKTAGCDEATGTATYVSVYGLDGARSLANECADEAKKALSIFDEKADFLRDFASYLLQRQK